MGVGDQMLKKEVNADKNTSMLTDKNNSYDAQNVVLKAPLLQAVYVRNVSKNIFRYWR